MKNDFQVLGVDEEQQTFLGQVFNGELPKEKQMFHARQITENEQIRAELRGLYRVLISYPVKTHQMDSFPEEVKKYFKQSDPEDLRIEKLHYIMRVATGFALEDAEGRPSSIARSTADGECTNDELGNLLENTMEKFGEWGIDMEKFVTDWTNRRKAAGKE